jgi:hypothetical protein
VRIKPSPVHILDALFLIHRLQGESNPLSFADGGMLFHDSPQEFRCLARSLYKKPKGSEKRVVLNETKSLFFLPGPSSFQTISVGVSFFLLLVITEPNWSNLSNDVKCRKDTG